MHNAFDVATARQLLADGTARRIREGAGLSLRDVAKDLGVAASAVSRWENEKRSPRGESALAYVALLERLMARNA